MEKHAVKRNMKENEQQFCAHKQQNCKKKQQWPQDAPWHLQYKDFTYKQYTNLYGPVPLFLKHSYYHSLK